MQVRMLSLVALFVLFIACINFMNLTTARSGTRAKEIGIRKVLGSSVQSIVLLLSKEFVKWVTLANIIAWPVAWYMSSKWLQDFAYRTSMSVWIFLFAGLLALAISLITISYQSIKAAMANPIDSLRYE